jgi:hypothetical protein
MTNMKSTPTFTIALNLLDHVPDLLKQGRSILQAMSPPNAWFPHPTPTFAVALANLDALQAAETLAETKAVGTVAARNAKQIVVEKDLKHLASYVQMIADANPGQEVVIISSAGMDIKQKATQQPSVFRVLEGDVSGSVELKAPHAGDRSAHYWQSSTDQKTWTGHPETIKASTTVEDLTPGTLYYFRHRVLTVDGHSDWDQLVSIMMK